MGIISSHPAAVLDTSDPAEGPFKARLHPDFPNGPMKNPEDLQTMQKFFLNAVEKFHDNEYLGVKSGNHYNYKSYSECKEISQRLGSGLRNLGIENLIKVGIYADNCPEWAHCIDASCLYGFVIVALYDSLGPDSLEYLIMHSKMECIISSKKNVPKVLNLLKKNHYAIKHLIVIADEIDFETEGLPFNVKTFKEVASSDITELPTIDPEDPHYICYSSGTTGNPKGVIISHRAALSIALAASYVIPMDENTRYLSYLPLAHVFERAAHAIVVNRGGKYGFNSDGVRNLKNDMQTLQPTLFAAVPRVLYRFYDAIQKQLKESKVKGAVFSICLAIKHECLKRGIGTGVLDSIVFDKIKRLMGGSIDSFIVGGAAMDPKIHLFLQDALGVPIRCGYGLTEAGSGNIIHLNYINDCIPGTVGGPIPNVIVKLEPIDDYDNPECGEVMIGGQCLCSGYLDDEENTNKLFSDEKHTFIHTGDVGMWTKEGHLKVVDRLRCIFKLSQGEYVSAELLTQTYEHASLVKNIFVYGDSMRTQLVAIVIPEEKEAMKVTGCQTYEEACKSEILKNTIKEQLDKEARDSKLFGYMFIKAIAVDSKEWTVDNGLMTPTLKIRRNALKTYYEKVIEELYQSLETNQNK